MLSKVSLVSTVEMIECCAINYCINAFYLHAILSYLISPVIIIMGFFLFKENIESSTKRVNFTTTNDAGKHDLLMKEVHVGQLNAHLKTD